MKKYASYQRTGLEWLGEVPSHWKLKKLKHLAHIKSGETITAAKIAKQGEYPVYGGNGIRGYSYLYTHEGNCILIGKQGASCGMVNYAVGKFCASEQAVVVSLRASSNLVWLGQLLRAMNLKQYSTATEQPALAVSTLQNLLVPLPPEDEQNSIAAWTDRYFSQLNQIISSKLKQINLLEDQRLSIISEAVTKGIAKNAPTKDSGIDGIGEIPARWDVTKIKRLGTISSDPHYISYTLLIKYVLEAIQLGSSKIAIPESLDEQRRIAAYLDQSCHVIENQVIPMATQINKLHEYCQSLLYEAVTGKIKVS